MNVLMWFKRDLRLQDHPALSLAAEMGKVLPLFILEPDQWRQAETSARQMAFLTESLTGLRDELAAIGAPLVVRTGDAVEVLDRLCRQNHIARILSHEEVGGVWAIARDLRVHAWAQSASVEWVRLAQPQGQVGPVPLPVPTLQSVQGVEPGPIPTAKALKLAEDRCPHRQIGGRGQALALLDGFLARRAENYRDAQTHVLGAERVSSRLSPHLTFGTLSMNEVMTATKARQAERPGGAWSAALARYQRNLALRLDNSDRPGGPPTCSHPTQLAPNAPLPFRAKEASRFSAWQRGETGLPFLDACMRALVSTGWLNARLRQMLISVASCQMGLDWQVTGPVLASRLTDFDPGLFWAQVQSVAGENGLSPAFCNPVRLGMAQDPTGAFTRFWLPELASVPDAFLQEPWKWSGYQRLAGHRFPEPIIDPVTAERQARQVLGAQRPKPVRLPLPPRPLPTKQTATSQLSLDL